MKYQFSFVHFDPHTMLETELSTELEATSDSLSSLLMAFYRFLEECPNLMISRIISVFPILPAQTEDYELEERRHLQRLEKGDLNDSVGNEDEGDQ